MTNRRFSSLALAISAAIAAATAPMPASAQDAAAAHPAMEEIIVTALKRAESLQEVPASISALTSNEMENLDLRTPSDLAAQVPNLHVTSVNGGSAPVFSLRGVSMFDFSLNQSGPIATYVDEVYKGNVALFGVQMFDLERVEVLRGPQGTLYGKNTTGGAINFNTKKPDFQTDGYLQLGAGEYSRRSAEGAVGGALIEDRLAGRVAFTYAKADGWLENHYPGGQDLEGLDEYGVRAALDFTVSDTLDIMLRLGTSEQKSSNYGIYARPGPAGIGGGLYALFNSFDPTLNPHLDYFRSGLGHNDIEANYTPDRKMSSDSAAVTIDWDATDTLKVTSITSWDQGDFFNPEDTDGSPLKVLELYYDADAEQFGEDLRLTSEFSGPFNFIAGAYVGKDTTKGSNELRFFNDLDINLDGAVDAFDCVSSLESLATPDPSDDLFPLGCRGHNSYEQERRNWAVYTDASYELSDSMTLHAGIRYTNDEGEFDPFTAQIRGNDGTPLVNTIPGDPANLDAQAKRDFNDGEVTGKLGLDYTTEAGTLLYANYSHGYRSSAFNGQAFFDPSELTVVDPETIDAVEAGLKSEWFDGRMTLNAAAFHYRYENQQLLDVDATTALQMLINIDSSEIDGAEIELSAKPLDPLTLHAGLALLDAKIDDATLRGMDISGNKLPMAPKYSANISADWETPLCDALALVAHVDASYSDTQYFEPFNIDRLEQEGYGLVNARLALRAADDRWELAAWGKNLGDKTYYTSAIDLIDTFGFDYFHVGAPRMFGVDATLRF